MKPKPTPAPKTDKITYPLGAKLIVIITILLLVSLGAITALVSDDVRRVSGTISVYL